jgi:tetratricopeptide (TPR) repeat protein
MTEIDPRRKLKQQRYVQRPADINFAQGCNAALLLLRSGQTAEAERVYRALLEMHPNHFDCLHNLATIRAQCGDYDEALRLVRRALRKKPTSAEAHNTLGVVLRATKQHQAAAASHRRALSLNPNYVSAYSNLGIVLSELGRHTEAAVVLERALQLDTAFAPIHNNFGIVLQALGQPLKAIAHYEKAIAIAPNYADAQANLGSAFTEIGRLAEAERAYEMAVKLSPRTAQYYHQLATTKRFTKDDPYFAAMEAIISGPISAEEQMHLCFALGKAYGDINDSKISFGYFVKANTLKRQQVIYDEVKALAELEQTMTVFTAEMMTEKQESGARSSVPVFIVGMPRSGTTLVEQILARHSRVSAGGELEDFGVATTDLCTSVGRPFPEAANGLTRVDLERLGRDYLGRIAAIAEGAERITDKLPTNFRFVGLIHLALPDAKVIHVRRDPVDTCLSCFSLFFRGDQPFTYDLGELGRYYRTYERLMQHWREILPRGVMIEVQYEDIVADFEGQAHRIVAHCGLEWEEGCLAFHEAARAVRTASATQVRQPIYSTSVGRWRTYRELLGPLLSALDISLDEGA